MRRMIALAVCLGVVGMSVCSCSRSGNSSTTESQPVETSIVYVYVNGDEGEPTQESQLLNTDVAPVRETEPIESTVSEEQIINEAIAEAEVALSQRDFDTALAIIADANHNVSDNEALLNEQNRINSLRPVSLLDDLNLMGGNPSIMGSEEISTGETVDAIGFEVYDIEAGETLRTGTGLSYALYGEYDTFTCSLALINDSSKNTPLDHFIEVYLDGVLTYTSPTITAGSMPADITVDISGAESIEIKFCCTNNTNEAWYGSMWAWDYYPISWVIVDPVFYPAYVPLENN